MIMVEPKVAELIVSMDLILQDVTVPKNIRKVVEDSKAHLLKPGELNLRSGNAIYALDSVSEDVNMPLHARTQIWNLLSNLERLRE